MTDTIFKQHMEYRKLL